MFSDEYQTLAESAHQNSEGKPLCDTEKIAQDIIDENLFSWLEFPDYFSLTSNKRLLSDDEEIMSLDDTSLLTSKTADFLNTKEKL